MLPSSRLLPLTIVGLAAAFSLRAYAVATTAPSSTALRSSATNAIAAMGAGAAIVTQARATEKPAGQSSKLAAPTLIATAAPAPVLPPAAAAPIPGKPAAAPSPLPQASVPPASPHPASTPSASVPPPAAAAMRVAPVAQEVSAADGPDVNRGGTGPSVAPPAAATPSDLGALGRTTAEERESQAAEREAMIAAAEKRLGERVGELVALQQRLQGLETGLKDRDEANWNGLVKLYEGMRPRDAAGIFNALDKPVLLEILDRMKPAKATPILGSMDPERARQATTDLASKRTATTTAAR